MRECEFCDRFEYLVDTIVDGKPAEICKNCADLHRAIILERPSKEKLKGVERVFSVRERLEEASRIKETRRLRGIAEQEKKTAFPETLSYRLRKAREKAGLSREKLANELGLNMQEIEKIEGGERPSEKALKRYTQYFKTKFEIEEEKEIKEAVGGGESFKDEKVSLKDLLDRAKTFFSGKIEKQSGEIIEIE